MLRREWYWYDITNSREPFIPYRDIRKQVKLSLIASIRNGTYALPMGWIRVGK